MYQIENSGAILNTKDRTSWLRISRNVLFLGITSLLTDISSEMIATTLPLYLAFGLRLAPLELGVIDGIYQGAAALVKLASGYVADRWQRHKEVAIAGYGLSAICKLGLLGAGASWGALAGVTLVDRIGKGIRTAPRDAIIAASTPKAQFATAFGAHRAMDTAGAMLGPLIASALLAFTANAYDAIFVVSFCFAVIGLAVLSLFVQNRKTTDVLIEGTLAQVKTIAIGDVARLLAQPSFRSIALIGGLFSLTTLSDPLLHLTFQRSLNFGIELVPLLFVFVALIYMVLAVPFGRIADRMGRTRMFIVGYGLLMAAYALVIAPVFGMASLPIYALLLGGYYAATDGVLIAAASAILPDHLRTSGLAILTTFTSLARLIASVVFGALWGSQGSGQAIGVFLAGMTVVVVLAALRLWRVDVGAVAGGHDD